MISKITLLGLFALLFISSCKNGADVVTTTPTTSDCAPPSGSLSYTFEGKQRNYLLYKPAGLPANAPLVIALHESGENNLNAYNNWGFNQIADTAKFVVCYPQAFTDCKWQIRALNTDDSRYIKALTQYLQTTHGLSSTRTFVTGFGYGGFMAYNMSAYGYSERIYGAVAVVGANMTHAAKNQLYTFFPPLQLPAMHIHGTNDAVIPFDGYPPDTLMPVKQFVDLWFLNDGFRFTDTIQVNPNIQKLRHWSNMMPRELWYYPIIGYGHTYPKASDASGLDASAEIWRFFRKY